MHLYVVGAKNSCVITTIIKREGESMARCKCNNPCTCYIEYDGDRPNTKYTSPYQYGRYNTRRSGTGSAFDPYVVEFLDSIEFQVEAGQVSTIADQVIETSNTQATLDPASMVVSYETPYEIFLALDATDAGDQILAPSYMRFWMASAQATFVYNGSTAGSRGIWLAWRPPANQTGVPVIYPGDGSPLVAGTSSAGSLSEDMTLSCSGFSPFLDRTLNPFVQGGVFVIRLQQSTPGNLTVRNVRFSLVAF